jgi:GNAT superfamily N-acetyltransferase
MPVEIEEVKTASQLRSFISLPSRLHTGYPFYVPPLSRDEYSFHDPKSNKELIRNKWIRFQAVKDGKTVGRIMGIIPDEWNRIHHLSDARFFQFDCINEYETAHTLIRAVEQWATDHGCNQLIGPFGFSDKDPQGAQVEGFDYLPVIASVSHQPYLTELITSCGYTKFKDCVSYRLDIPKEIPEFYRKINTRTLLNHHVRLIEFNSRKALRSYFTPVMNLLNQGYHSIYGFMPMTVEDIHKLAKQYLQFLDPELVKVVANEQDRPVAFVIAMANISEGLKISGGKIFPFGFYHLLKAMRTSTQMDLLLGAVDDQYRGRGLNVLMGTALMDSARKKGLTVMDSHLILEENRLMRAELEKLGGELYKRYRIFHKTLTRN